MPRSGWEHFGDYDDLGGLDGTCELCGTSIRYVFLVYHAKWGTMEVGEICCDHLTSTVFAAERMDARRKLIERRKRFASAKIAAFDLIDPGRVNAFLQKRKRRAMDHHRDLHLKRVSAIICGRSKFHAENSK
jgi:hypothetical protein